MATLLKRTAVAGLALLLLGGAIYVAVLSATFPCYGV